MTTRMKVDSKKGIFPDFGRNILDGCIDEHVDLSLGYLAMNLAPLDIQEMPCL